MGFCGKCGKEVNPSDKFCTGCGEPSRESKIIKGKKVRRGTKEEYDTLTTSPTTATHLMGESFFIEDGVFWVLDD